MWEHNKVKLKLKLKKFEDVTLFLKLGPRSTLACHENALLVWVWMENILKTELSENDGVTIII